MEQPDSTIDVVNLNPPVATVELDDVVTQAMKLSALDRVRLIERLVVTLKNDVTISEATKPTPKQSLYGIARHLGPSPSAEDIDEARREAWANFPREDIA